MITYKIVPAGRWSKLESTLFAFARRNSDNRLTLQGLHVLRKTIREQEKRVALGQTQAELAAAEAASGTELLYEQAQASVFTAVREDTALVIALRDTRLVGFAFAASCGERACMVVTHPSSRKQGVGATMLGKLRSYFGGKLSCDVALDNPASIQMCFGAGLHAVSMHDGPTGKPTMHFTAPA
jgi:GNAT superfamily N-acetyltransferase